MGREIRMVPPDWEHPRYTQDNAPNPRRVGDFIPLFDQDFQSAAREWIRDLHLWIEEKHPEQLGEYPSTEEYYWEESPPPERESYRERSWSEAEATHFQMYETVSEGTPVTPHFATKEELVDHLVKNGDFWDQERGNGGWSRKAAEAFVNSGWAPSGIVSDGQFKTVRDDGFFAESHTGSQP